MYKRLMETPVGAAKEELRGLLRAAVFLIRRAIRDIVTPVSPAPLSRQLQWEARRAPGGHSSPRGRLVVAALSASPGVSLGIRALEGQPQRPVCLSLTVPRPRSRARLVRAPGPAITEAGAA